MKTEPLKPYKHISISLESTDHRQRMCVVDAEDDLWVCRLHSAAPRRWVSMEILPMEVEEPAEAA